MTSEPFTHSMKLQYFLLLVLITMIQPLPAGSRAVVNWPLVASDLTSMDVDDHRRLRSAPMIPMSTIRATTSNDDEETRDPWQINQNLCPPSLAHLCNIQHRTPNGETQSSFVTPFFEGDIVLDWEQRRNLGLAGMLSRSSQSGSRHRPRRAIIKGRDRRWPDAIIPYTIDSDFNHEAVKLIRSALKHWQQNTCIRFVHKESSHQDYLRFAYIPGCWSFIGRQGGEQLLSMNWEVPVQIETGHSGCPAKHRQTKGSKINVRAAKKQKKGPCIQSESGDGREYRGDIDFTETGVTCQRWTSKYPHEHGFLSEDEASNEGRGIGHHNFCRNPGGQRLRPWCFTTLERTIWEYCDIKICPAL
eukprot:XP_011667713.1 PREDICTED: uncharacterized protein LOC105439885 [Strongylocentrotus purpuratus]